MTTTELDRVAMEGFAAAAERAMQAIPPAWPLASSVAVNPFLGHADHDLVHAGARLSRVAGCPVTLPRGWYRERIASGAISDDDLRAALEAAPAARRPADLVALKLALDEAAPPPRLLPTVADLAAKVSGIDWPGIIADRFTHWAAGYFDEGQALWAAPRGASAFAAWRALAVQDLTPEILGLAGFSNHVAGLPESAGAALTLTARALGLSPAAAESYFHQLMLTLGGWSQYARYLHWHAKLEGREDSTLADCLAIRISWEGALLSRHAPRIEGEWARIRGEHERDPEVTRALAVDAILQEALERGAQRALAQTLAKPTGPASKQRPALQMIFCIDVRSEVFRRALESVSPRVETRGFAGFFGIGTAHRRFASDREESRLPVLLTPGFRSRAGREADAAADVVARYAARAKRAWGRFKLAAVSCFAFVEAAGPLYGGKLVADALGLRQGRPAPEPAPRFDPALDRPTRSAVAASVLRAMSLTDGFGRLVLIAGHGAHVVNNPHASALQCGACGGFSGEVNARLLASLLNDGAVRADLAAAGIDIPSDTLFLAALHDTTTDRVTIYDTDQATPPQRAGLAEARRWLDAAGALARAERALRLPRAPRGVLWRGRDWSQPRPEWALAGCHAFIAAPRARTVGKSLEGRAFLHDYQWRDDAAFKVLELILTAPVVVASWISLQYYGSTVAPEIFGAGNKLLHNVVGGIGVIEGNSGPLRAGLPWQSVHDGERLAHEPLRLSVCVEAPRDAVSAVLGRHPDVRRLFDNRWLHLFALDDEGQMAWRYDGDLRWIAMGQPGADQGCRPELAA